MTTYGQRVSGATFAICGRNCSPCEAADCLIWVQELYNDPRQYLGGLHGFAGNAVPVINGWSLLTTGEQSDWSRCINRTLRATAIREGGLVKLAVGLRKAFAE